MSGSPEVLEVGGARPLVGAVDVPGDKSISHRALLLSALAEGTSGITGLSGGDDVTRTRHAVEALGAIVAEDGALVTVEGGRSRLSAPASTIDLGNSGTGMRLLAGVVATVPGTTRLTGDDSLRSRPMDRVADPLALMGATVVGEGERCLPPLAITGRALHGIDYTPPMASAQVKSAVLLAGLVADGETVVREPVATRAHTEEMLAEAGADIEVEPWGEGRVVRLRPSTLRARSWEVPGDPSQAAFWVVAGAVVPGSRVTVDQVHLGAERIGFLHVLIRMGADVTLRDIGGDVGSITASYSRLTGTTVESTEIPSLDEVPILAVAALVADGPTRFRDLGELRVKESDRLEGTARLVRAFGGVATVEGDDLVVEGGTVPAPGTVDAEGDHRMAMAAAVAAAAVPSAGRTVIHGWEAVATSYPGFAETLDRLAGEDR
ncbi:MAG TPA: 3-phosphoshikimate 1-carboxyvinyltransferase [Acidimicrobiales bacterium]